MNLRHLILVTVLVPILWTFGCRSKAPERAASLDLARRLNVAFVTVAEKVAPSVVVINVMQKLPPSEAELDDNGNYDALPPGFWRRFHEQFDRPETIRGEGSGLIIREDGYILTNQHVVEDSTEIEVTLKDGRKFKAVVRGADPQSDLAVLKVEARGLPVAKMADSSRTRVGEFAVAIGAPFSLDYSVTFGHVSAKGRANVVQGSEGASMDQDFLQTDANINPGNSGGPLVNIDGEVIGINTLIRGMHTGIGFAIPSNFAREISDKLIAEGKFARSWLGIGIRSLAEDADLKSMLKNVAEGVVVASIVPNGPAATSDLKPGDVITAVDGRKVATPQQLRNQIRTKPPGRPVSLDLARAGATLVVKVKPGEWVPATKTVQASARRPAPTPPTHPAGTNSLGLVVQDLTPELAAQFGAVSLAEGVLVTRVEENSVAARKSIKPGDRITALNQKPVRSEQQFRAVLAGIDLAKGVIVNLVSGSTARFEILKPAP